MNKKIELGELAANIHAAISAYIDRKLSVIHLNMNYYFILRFIKRNFGCTKNKIMTNLKLSDFVVKIGLEHLLQKGFIYSISKKRHTKYSVSKKGAEIEMICHKIIDIEVNKLTKNIRNDKLEKFEEMINELSKNLGDNYIIR